MKAKHNLGSPQVSAPFPPPSRGVQHVVEARFYDAVEYFVGDQPAKINGKHTRAMQFGGGGNALPVSSPITTMSCVAAVQLYRSRVHHYNSTYSIHLRRSSDCVVVVCRKHALAYFATNAKAMARGRAISATVAATQHPNQQLPELELVGSMTPVPSTAQRERQSQGLH